MKSIALCEGVFHLQSGSNVGLILAEGQALLVDAGLDGGSARRALRLIGEESARLTAIVVTHAHADHFGGAAYLQERFEVPVYAPRLEAAVMENPLLEPVYLFGGAAPIKELRQKFTLADPCEVEERVTLGPVEIGPFHVEIVGLSGHALNQVGVAVVRNGRRVLFCADAVFPEETIAKHQVLFCVDFDQTVATMRQLPHQPFDCYAPGHGPAYEAGGPIEKVCEANSRRLEEVRGVVYEAVSEPVATPVVVQRVSQHFGLRIKRPTAYFLTRTTVLAALSSLEAAEMVAATTQENVMVWKHL